MIILELICSQEFNKLLNPTLSDCDWIKTIHYAKSFERIYRKNILHILDEIPKYTGRPWEYNLYAPIFIVNYGGPSRTNPLLLKIDSPQNMLIKLIHELVHLNFPYDAFLNEEMYEDIINQVTEKISDDLSIVCDALDKIKLYHEELLSKGIPLKKIPLDEQTVDQYLKGILSEYRSKE